MGTPTTKPPPSSKDKELDFGRAVLCKLTQLKIDLETQFGALQALASRNERTGNTDVPSSAAEESSPVHFAACFVMLHSDLISHMCQMSWTILKHHKIKGIQESDCTFTMFRLMAEYSSNVTPSASNAPDPESLGEMMEQLGAIVHQQEETLKNLLEVMKEWAKDHTTVLRFLLERCDCWDHHYHSIGLQLER